MNDPQEKRDGAIEVEMEVLQALAGALGRLRPERVAPVLGAALHIADQSTIANAVLAAGKASPR